MNNQSLPRNGKRTEKLHAWKLGSTLSDYDNRIPQANFFEEANFSSTYVESVSFSFFRIPKAFLVRFFNPVRKQQRVKEIYQQHKECYFESCNTAVKLACSKSKSLSNYMCRYVCMHVLMSYIKLHYRYFPRSWHCKPLALQAT